LRYRNLPKSGCASDESVSDENPNDEFSRRRRYRHSSFRLRWRIG
jgi:hypothetical protein